MTDLEVFVKGIRKGIPRLKYKIGDLVTTKYGGYKGIVYGVMIKTDMYSGKNNYFYQVRYQRYAGSTTTDNLFASDLQKFVPMQITKEYL
jgi:hypothetical protein